MIAIKRKILVLIVAVSVFFSIAGIFSNTYASTYYKTVTKNKTITKQIRFKKYQPKRQVYFKCKLKLYYKTKSDYKKNKPSKKVATVRSTIPYSYFEKTKTISKENGKWVVKTSGKVADMESPSSKVIADTGTLVFQMKP